MNYPIAETHSLISYFGMGFGILVFVLFLIYLILGVFDFSRKLDTGKTKVVFQSSHTIQPSCICKCYEHWGCGHEFTGERMFLVNGLWITQYELVNNRSINQSDIDISSLTCSHCGDREYEHDMQLIQKEGLDRV
jgi:hypothetical protein